MRQRILASGSEKNLRPRAFSWRALATLAAVAILAQAAVLQAFRQFTSEALAQRASALTDRRLFSQAHVQAQRAANLYPYNAYALFRMGASDFAAGSSREHQARAAQSLEKARTYIPHKPNVLRLLAQSYYYLGRYDESAAAFDQFARMVPAPDPDSGTSHLQLVHALAHFRAATGAHQGQAALPMIIASSNSAVKSDIAIPQLLNALYLNQPHSAEALVREWIHEKVDGRLTTKQVQELFAAATGSGRLKLLTDILAAALQGEKRQSRLSKYLAGAYLKSEQTSEAAALVQELRRKFPEDADFPLLLGDIEVKRKNLPAARAHYQEHLRLNPSSAARADIVAKVGELP